MPQRANITDIQLRNAKPPQSGAATIWDGAIRNFGVRISSGGTKSFIILLGKGRRQTIGRYPVISLAQARDKATKLFAEKTLGRHAPSTITWEDATAEFLEGVERNNRPRTHEDYRRILTSYFPLTGKLENVSKQQMAGKLDRLVNTPTQRNNALVVAKIFFRWSVNRGYLNHSPLEGLTTQKQPSRTRVLSDDELRRVWIAAGTLGTFGIITRLLICTGQRRSEIGSLQSSWLQNDVLTIPAHVAKNGRSHSIPLSPLSKTLAIGLATSRHSMKPYCAWSKPKKLLDEASGVTGYCLHDLRRSYVTNMARLGVPLPVIERLVNHVSGSFAGIVGIYQRHSFMPEMEKAVAAYEEYLGRLVSE